MKKLLLFILIFIGLTSYSFAREIIYCKNINPDKVDFIIRSENTDIIISTYDDSIQRILNVIRIVKIETTPKGISFFINPSQRFYLSINNNSLWIVDVNQADYIADCKVQRIKDDK